MLDPTGAPDLGKVLMVLGAVLLVVGAAVHFGPSIPWLGRLPGDVRVERPGFRFYAPITTCILLSLALTLLARLFGR